MTAQLMETAARLRSVLEEYGRSTSDLWFSGFPRGCCGIVSELVGRYLIELGYSDVMYVCGENDEGKSHAWVEVGQIIVDITADQFGTAPVVVTSDSDWHRSYWKIDEDFDPPRPPICDPQKWMIYPEGAWTAIKRG